MWNRVMGYIGGVVLRLAKAEEAGELSHKPFLGCSFVVGSWATGRLRVACDSVLHLGREVA